MLLPGCWAFIDGRALEQTNAVRKSVAQRLLPTGRERVSPFPMLILQACAMAPELFRLCEASLLDWIRLGSNVAYHA